MSFTTVRLATARVLRDQPSLRTTDMREKVWLLVKQSLPCAKFSTVERIIRQLQNDKGLYLPRIEDDRFVNQEYYREEFGNATH